MLAVICAAVSVSEPIEPGTVGSAYGWGAYDDNNHGKSTTRLRGKDGIETLPCTVVGNKFRDYGGEKVSSVWETSQAPMYICTLNVGLCGGDSGGNS